MNLPPTLEQLWNRPWALTVLAGVLLGLSFPPLPFPFLTFLGMLAVLRIVDLSDSPREAALYTWVGFIIWNTIVTYWLMMATVAAGIAAIVANAAVMTLPVMMQKKTADWFRRPWLVALLQACWWVGFEYLHHHWDLAWPWLSLGNAWSNAPALVQYISVTGYLGISFWVVLTAALAYRYLAAGDAAGQSAWKSEQQADSNRAQDAAGKPRNARTTMKWGALAVLLAFPGISLVQYALQPSPESVSDSTLNTVVVQPNFDSYQSNGGYPSPVESAEHIQAQTDSLIRLETDLVLWPENGIYPGLTNDSSTYSMASHIQYDIHEYARKRRAVVIGGTTYYEYFEEGESPGLPAISSEGEPYLAYNSGLAFYPNRDLRIYRKHNLVPIVERMPYVHTLNAIDVFGLVDWSNIQGYGKGWEPTLFPVDGTHVPALVCYDSVFPSWVRKFVNGGAGVIAVITNDGWWGETGGHEQHFAYARLRAIEFRRFVLRSANNGISGVIGPDGSVKVRTKFWEEDVFRYEVPVLEQQTLYARFGSWLPWLCLLGGFGSLVWRGVRGYRE